MSSRPNHHESIRCLDQCLVLGGSTPAPDKTGHRTPALTCHQREMRWYHSPFVRGARLLGWGTGIVPSFSISWFHTRTLLVQESGVPSMVFLPLVTTSLMKWVTTKVSLTKGVTIRATESTTEHLKLILEQTAVRQHIQKDSHVQKFHTLSHERSM